MSLSKIGIVIIVMSLVAGGVGVLGYFSYSWINPGKTTTSMTITIDSNFGLALKNGTNLSPLNSTFNCSYIAVAATYFSWNVYNAIDAFFNANKTAVLGPNNILAQTGVSWFQIGVNEGIFANNFSIFSETPSPTTRLEGQSNTFNFGNYVVCIPVIMVGTYRNSTTYKTGGFTFKSITAFLNGMDSDSLNYTTWKSATFLKGQDSMVVKEWKYDVNKIQNSTLDVVFNGAEMDLVWGSLIIV